MRQQLDTQHIDLVVLDLMLPDEDGLALARHLNSNNVPFVMVTGKDDVVDKVVGLELGADDYITKPFHARELTARIGMVLRRLGAKQEKPSSDAPDDNTTVKFNEWSFNTVTGELVSNEGEKVPLTTYEFRILAVLATRPNRPLSRDQILDLAASREWEPQDRSIDVLIGKLRKKLKDDPKSPQYIKTLRSQGYMFICKTSPA